jgi:hypothetical protein
MLVVFFFVENCGVFSVELLYNYSKIIPKSKKEAKIKTL